MDLTLYNDYFALESFESVIDDSSIFKPANDQAYLEELYTEATAGATISNILSKIIRFIIKSLKWLVSRVVQFGNWLKNKILGKNKKTADQIVEEILGNDLGSSAHDTKPRARAPRAPRAPKAPKNAPNSNNKEEKVIKVEIPSADSSTVKPDDVVEVAFKTLRIAFNNDRMYVKVGGYDKPIDTIALVDRKLVGKLPPAKRAPDPAQALYVIEFIRNEALQNRFRNIVDSLEKLFQPLEKKPDVATIMVKLDEAKLKKKVAEQCNDLLSDLNKINFSDNHYVLLSDVSEFGKLLNHAADVISNLEAVYVKPQPNDFAMNSQLSSKDNPNWKIRENRYPITETELEAFNMFGSIVTVLSFGMNELTGSMSKIYMIDAKYMHSIDNIDTLSRFVERMAECGFPSKYIMYNTYLIAAENLNGGKASGTRPIWGQSRCIFYPNDQDHIIKIAYNPIGKVGNRNEAYITKLLHGTPESKYIAQVQKITKNAYVTEGERVNTSGIGSFDWNKCMAIKNKINASPRLVNTNIEITDIHPKNIGTKKDGSLCIIDYGGITRQR